MASIKTISKILIIIPAYNEAENLKNFIPALSAILAKETAQFEIIVINDGSTDATLEVLKELLTQYPLHILSFSRKKQQNYCTFENKNSSLHPK